jgi:hypothetical protein
MVPLPGLAAGPKRPQLAVERHSENTVEFLTRATSVIYRWLIRTSHKTVEFLVSLAFWPPRKVVIGSPWLMVVLDRRV